jgi:hypothetical protein
MRKINKFLCGTLMGIFFVAVTGCDNFLEREPLSELSPGTFFKSKGDMRTWMAGTYDELQTALLGSTCGALEWGDLRSDNYGNTGYGDTRVYLNAIDGSQAQWDWAFLYRVINRCNVGIEKFPLIPSALPADYNDNLGQLHGLRALMYFYLIRVWGDAPLTTQPWDGILSSAYLPRSPVEEIKSQILSDIDKALELTTADIASARRFNFNRAAAWALKTDVHMWFHEYQEAKDASEYFVTNTTLKLVATASLWKSQFTDPATSTESIFTLNWSQDVTLPDGGNTWAQRVGASNTNNTYQVSRIIFNEFIDRLRTPGKGKDGRFWGVLDTLKLFNDAVGVKTAVGYNHYGRNGTAKNTKFSIASSAVGETWIVFHSDRSTIQLPVYRLADALLLRAEALNQLGQGTDALTIVNSIRARVGYTADAKTEVDNTNKEEVLNVILLERQLEFMAEGKRWFDLMRNDKVIEVMDPIMQQRQIDYRVEITGFGDPGRIKFPIYYKEFEANPALRGAQNPPYTE